MKINGRELEADKVEVTRGERNQVTAKVYGYTEDDYNYIRSSQMVGKIHEATGNVPTFEASFEGKEYYCQYLQAEILNKKVLKLKFFIDEEKKDFEQFVKEVSK